MFDVEAFYKAAHRGKPFDENELIAHIKKYKNVVIWGGGNLGKAVCNKLIDLGVHIDCFWDKRFESISYFDNTPIKRPFDREYSPDDTMVIIGIANGSIGDLWTREEVLKQGYNNYLIGMYLYEALICPFKEGDTYDGKVCLHSEACNQGNCYKCINLIGEKNEDLTLTWPVLTCIVSTRCTLKCINCGQRMNDFPKDKRVNFSLDNIKRDIEVMMKAANGVVFMSIIGGEPFVHPQLDKIVQYCVEKKNIGLIKITTCGVCKMTKEILENIKNDRVRIMITDYTEHLSDQQRKVFNNNIELMNEVGIDYQIFHSTWYAPGKIKDYNYSEQVLQERKEKCEVKRMSCAIANGKYYPCPHAIATNMMGLYNFEEDYVDLHHTSDLKQALKACLEKKSYETCRYCGDENIDPQQVSPGEQLK